MFQGDVWPVIDDADTLLGHSLGDILKQKAGLASNDLYGKLHCYLHDQLSLFRRSLRTSNSSNFKLYNMDAKALAGHLGGAVTFDRIEVL
jgi:hypothetical protein